MALKALVLIVVVASASAFPTFIPAAQIPGAVRSPCPALNALANHGFLPRDGKDISLPTLVQACADGFNVGADICQAVGQTSLSSDAAIARGGANATTFNLDDIDQHDLIEHDASLSRTDFFFGDDHSFNASLYASTKVSPKDGLHTTETAGPVRAARIAESAANTPGFNESKVQGGWGQSALYLSAMGDPTTGIANATFVDSLFELERLPYELGWRPSAFQTNKTTQAALLIKLKAAAAAATTV